MHVIADLQLHSRFSRAVSKDMTLPNIAAWAARKGIKLVATGDWTHPLWLREIEKDLEETGNGLLRLKQGAEVGQTFSASPPSLSPSASSAKSANGVALLEKAGLPAPSPLFLLATEISCIYTQGGKMRRVHTLVWVPSLKSARKINQEMTRSGCNLLSDGRPIIGLTSIQLAELVLSLEPKALIIPAHAWTPWFSLYGSMSGFDSIDEAFGPFAKNIYAVETGLSSSPAMNWRIAELDNRAIVSFSDAHSGPKLGREATVFDVGELTYESIYQAINSAGAKVGTPWSRDGQGPDLSGVPKDLGARAMAVAAKGVPPRAAPSIAYTIEFYPEEGKYHYTGHRLCNIRLSPQETRQKGTTCPVCGKALTIGVAQRVEDLASRSEEDLKLSAVNYQLSAGAATVRMVSSRAFPNRPPFVMLVPLQEIIAEAIGSPVASPKVQSAYGRLTEVLGGEFTVLLSAATEEIAKLAGSMVAQGVEKVRQGEIVIDPGYDGVFGVVAIWRGEEGKPLLNLSREQLSMF
ncbi:MAG: endonuclease Q family protein [Patescibacteria group bacterium]